MLFLETECEEGDGTTTARWEKVLQMQSRGGPSHRGGLRPRQTWVFGNAVELSEGGKFLVL